MLFNNPNHLDYKIQIKKYQLKSFIYLDSN